MHFKKMKINKLRRFRFRMQEMPTEASIEFAKAKRLQMLEGQTILYSQTTDMAKWLLASLLTLNSGGFIAMLSNVRQINHPSLIGIFYCGGVLSALLNGWLIQRSVITDMPLFREAHDYWLIAETTTNRFRRSEYLLHKFAVRSVFNKRWIPLAGWLSAILFSIASVTLACSLKISTPQANVAGDIQDQKPALKSPSAQAVLPPPAAPDPHPRG
ncbi:hypothetical protein FHW96_002872 [Novosphingobium sp. SG751A]|uniref:hypothetical protein n=1 Tax=Novosphingobium sp. SG751A TaxID=2587000 RepID=UPI0015539ED2|nr:hypothetical protein [Novosphingobium sp. SG751A]NOW46712.1 hypothetical protein [Novosphingobium sp. SG751A]